MTRPWYPFYWSDYSGKTQHLTQGEHGAYILLMRYIYTTGKPIPEKLAYRVAMATLEQEKQNVDNVLSEFFYLKDGWRQKNIEKIMGEAEEKHKKAVESGAKGAQARYSNPSRVAIVTTTTTTPTTTATEKKDTPAISSSEIFIFERFWEQFPKQRAGSRLKALRAWHKAKSSTDHEEILLGCLAYAQSDEVKRGFAKGCAAWLNDERWKSDYSIKTQKDNKPDYFKDTVLKAVHNVTRGEVYE